MQDVFCVHRTNEGDAAALQGLCLDVRDGEVLCVLGPSGAGKTTLLQLIAALRTPSAGVVRVLGEDIGRLSARLRARFRQETIGFLDQDPQAALPPDLPVGQAVELPLALRGAGRATRQARAGELLAFAALEDRAGALPCELSGGERQRIALCAALAHRPVLMLADEPTGELDQVAAQAMRALLTQAARTHGTTVIVVSHDQATADSADRSVAIRDGRIVEDRRNGRSALIVGRGGWLQLPPEMLAAAGIGGRARVEAVSGGGVIVTAADADGARCGDGADSADTQQHGQRRRSTDS